MKNWKNEMFGVVATLGSVVTLIVVAVFTAGAILYGGV